MKKKFINLKAIRTNENTITISFDNQLTANEKVTVYYNDSTDFTGEKKFLLESNSNVIEFKDPLPLVRTYFLIESTEFSSEIIAERVLPLEGACNFRDLGGFETTDGKKVKWNCFYRSGTLANLTDNDLKYLDLMDFKKILDYRSKQEATYEKDKPIKNPQYINISAMNIEENFNGNLDMEYLLKNSSNLLATSISPIEFLEKSYESMVFKNKAFEELIDILKEDDIRPFVQHCKSGKDRTGIGSALVLLLLAVPMDKVKEDYLASNTYRKAFNDSSLEKYKAYLDDDNKISMFKMIMEVKEEYFDAAFNKIFNKYNNIEDYFKAEYNLTDKDIQNIRDKYLY